VKYFDMRKIAAALRMIFICCFIMLYLIIVGLPILIYCKIVNNPRLGLRFAKLLDRMLLFFAELAYQVQGIEKLAVNQGYVYVGNHRSFADVAVVFLVLPGDLRYLAKKELFKIPLVSFALRTLGIIEVDRSDPDEAAKSIDRAVDELKAGRSIILFPEGTRSRLKGMLPFKKGAFVLAIKAQVPVVPFTLIGTDNALKPDTIFLYPAQVKVILHEPIQTKGMSLEDRNDLLERTRQIIESTFLAHQAREKEETPAEELL
jgi:1-acyl-sn-glycerol-3-phosphate acyltransferase